jgi:hypothetical protein
MPPPPVELPAAPVPQLSQEALTRLADARAAVAEARRTRTLWLSAANLLKDAERAAAQQDSPATIRLSNEIVAVCEKSALQARQAPVVW